MVAAVLVEIIADVRIRVWKQMHMQIIRNSTFL